MGEKLTSFMLLKKNRILIQNSLPCSDLEHTAAQSQRKEDSHGQQPPPTMPKIRSECVLAEGSRIYRLLPAVQGQVAPNWETYTDVNENKTHNGKWATFFSSTVLGVLP